jgi:arsenate reductase
MKYILIEYPKCSTCQKAKKFLTENNIDFETRNIVTETPTIEELKEWIKISGIPINKFFNTSGLLYRSMNLKEELKSLSDEEKIAMLASNGMLIKRPLLVLPKKNIVLLGFKIDEWQKIK